MFKVFSIVENSHNIQITYKDFIVIIIVWLTIYLLNIWQGLLPNLVDSNLLHAEIGVYFVFNS